MDTTLRGAIVGFGFIASHGHLPAYLRRERERGDVSIVAIADLCPERRAAALERCPGVRVYTDHESLLAGEADRLDFIDIATPPGDHARIGRAALGRGLHVLCEKPLATTTADARDMIDRARWAQRVLFPVHNYHHAPVVKAVRRILDTEVIGRVHMVTLNTFRSTHARGVSEWRPDWRRDRQTSGGGIAMDHGSHSFYLAFDWLGGYPTSVTAKMSTRDTFDTEDNFSCTLTFPHGFAAAQLSWTAGARKVIYTLHGERGAITVDDDDVQLVAPGRREKWSIASDWVDPSHSRWFESLFDQFGAAIARNDYVGKQARDAFQCIKLIETAYASARQGCLELALGQLSA